MLTLRNKIERRARCWLNALARWKRLRTMLPSPLRRVLRLLPAYRMYLEERWKADHPVPSSLTRSFGGRYRTELKLGIIREFTNLHIDYVNACVAMGVPFEIVDIAGDAWISEVERSDCAAFLVRPAAHHSVWKRMFDDRLWIMVHEMGKVIYPSYKEIWLYESKRRTCDWLVANNIPHPRTAVFFDRQAALDFVESAAFPLVYKSDIGSSALGIRILKTRRAARRHVMRCFGRGYLGRDSEPRDRQWGYVLLQEYLASVKEWRMIRIGDSYFGHQKRRQGDFHSGTGLPEWCDPPTALLDFTREVTDRGGFTSMNVDVFQTTDGRLLVNELQTVFGWVAPSQMYVDGKPGRYLYDEVQGTWSWEEGLFCENGGANLRVDMLLKSLESGNALGARLTGSGIVTTEKPGS